jgi:ABC-type branched-subunit amino acid transport system ATPase component/ABC-type branched-subunit amino acid transport system permease subunit
MLVGVLATIPAGLIVGLAGMRTRGVNLAIVTLGFAISIDSVVFASSKFNGGPTRYTANDPTFFGIRVNSIDFPERYATLTLIFLVLVGIGLANIRRGRVGRRLIAVRTNERAAAALGVSIVGAKLYAFVVGGLIAGIGGVLLAFRLPVINFSSFNGGSSIFLLESSVFGGVGTLGGPLVGSGFQAGTLGTTIFSFLGGKVALYIALATSIGLLIMLTRFPDGLFFLTRRHNEWWLGPLRRRFPGRRKPVDVLAVDSDEPMQKVPATSLDVRGVTVRFGGTIALNNVSLTVRTGEVVGLIGPNGAGKSTMIDAITGFVTPAEGSVHLGDASIDSWSRERRARSGVTRSFQTLELFDDLTVLENIRAADDARDLLAYLTDPFAPGRPHLRPAARAAVIDLGLQDDLDRTVHELPYAQRRMLAVARAVAGGQPLLLLDEPASGLDAAQSRRLGEIIRRLAAERGIGVLLIEHNVDMVLRTCDRVYALNFGTLIGEGTPNEIRANPAVIEAYLGTTSHDEAVEPAAMAPA